jgi:hypothetical protein
MLLLVPHLELYPQAFSAFFPLIFTNLYRVATIVYIQSFERNLFFVALIKLQLNSLDQKD